MFASHDVQRDLLDQQGVEHEEGAGGADVKAGQPFVQPLCSAWVRAMSLVVHTRVRVCVERVGGSIGCRRGFSGDELGRRGVLQQLLQENEAAPPPENPLAFAGDRIFCAAHTSGNLVPSNPTPPPIFPPPPPKVVCPAPGIVQQLCIMLAGNMVVQP